MALYALARFHVRWQPWGAVDTDARAPDRGARRSLPSAARSYRDACRSDGEKVTPQGHRIWSKDAVTVGLNILPKDHLVKADVRRTLPEQLTEATWLDFDINLLK